MNTLIDWEGGWDRAFTREHAELSFLTSANVVQGCGELGGLWIEDVPIK